jgi:hypothetical protein
MASAATLTFRTWIATQKIDIVLLDKETLLVYMANYFNGIFGWRHSNVTSRAEF